MYIIKINNKLYWTGRTPTNEINKATIYRSREHAEQAARFILSDMEASSVSSIRIVEVGLVELY